MGLLIAIVVVTQLWPRLNQSSGTPPATRPTTAVVSNNPTQPAAQATAPNPASPVAQATAPAVPDGMGTIARDQLPAEALTTLDLISRGGPFPYRQDNTIFQNRERLLPIKPRGYYREYTVETPGSRDRGARRIVKGEQGELYYTDDHYDSFRVILP